MSTPETGSGAARIDRVLEKIRKEDRVGLMTHIVLGYPTLEASRYIVEAMVRSGVDIIEVQLPFSDPTADGPTITLACHRALERKVKIEDGLRFVSEFSEKHPVAFVFMSYFNLLFNYRWNEEGPRGVAAFARDAAAAGASGLIVPDIPPEESQEGFPEACRENGLYPVYVISPNISKERLRAVGRVGRGFLYSTSRTGTTGKDMEIELEELGKFLKQARKICRLPLAVGFSISRRHQIEALKGHAEIAVVGSHLIRVFEKHGLNSLERELRTLAGRKD